MESSASTEVKIAKVLVLDFKSDRLYDYKIPADLSDILAAGMQVKIPFRNRDQLCKGIVMSIVDADEEYDRLDSEHSLQNSQNIKPDRDFIRDKIIDPSKNPENLLKKNRESKLKTIDSVVSESQFFTESQLKLCSEVAQYYGGTIQQVLKSAIPDYMQNADKAFKQFVAEKEKNKKENKETRAEAIDLPVSNKNSLSDAESTITNKNLTSSPFSDYTNANILYERLLLNKPARCVCDLDYGKAKIDGIIFDKYVLDMIKTACKNAEANKKTLIALPSEREIELFESVLNLYMHGLDKKIYRWNLGEQKRKTKKPSSMIPEPKDLTDQKDFPNISSKNIYVRYSYKETASVRYTSYLACMNGYANIILTTRSGVLLPIKDLSLTILCDDINSSYKENRAPYFHARETLILRSTYEKCSLMIASYVPSAQSLALIDKKWAFRLSKQSHFSAPADLLPKLYALNSETSPNGSRLRIPDNVINSVREALEKGTVLIQVPRKGYINLLCCVRCHELLKCDNCYGKLYISSTDHNLKCSVCCKIAADWHCRNCNCNRYAHIQKGTERTAEELGKAFPKAKITVSSKERNILRNITLSPMQIVIATPNSEPKLLSKFTKKQINDNAFLSAEEIINEPDRDGLQLAVLLDASHFTSPLDNSMTCDSGMLDAWFRVASSVKSQKAGGKVFLIGDVDMNIAKAFLRNDAYAYAAEDYKLRSSLSLPPFYRTCSITGLSRDVENILEELVKRGAIDKENIFGPVNTNDIRTSNQYLFSQFEYAHFSANNVKAVLKVENKNSRNLANAIKSITGLMNLKRSGNKTIVVFDSLEFL